MTRAFVGIGSNVGDREAHLRRAVEALAAHGLPPVARSSVYESEAVGPPQPDYLNAAVEVSTSLGPRELLGTLKGIEEEVGRTPGERWGPREIDLDLLLFGDAMLEEPGLVVPHPELTRRSFVLAPLLEIDPDLELPSGEPLSAFCERDPPGLRRLGSL